MNTYSVLIVDDDVEVREALQRAITDELRQCRCHHTHDVNTAIQLLQYLHIDFVVSDVQMPEKNGDVLYRWIERQCPELVERFAFHSHDVQAPIHGVPFFPKCKLGVAGLIEMIERSIKR